MRRHSNAALALALDLSMIGQTKHKNTQLSTHPIHSRLKSGARIEGPKHDHG
jgi:hypothetical protein